MSTGMTIYERFLGPLIFVICVGGLLAAGTWVTKKQEENSCWPCECKRAEDTGE